MFKNFLELISLEYCNNDIQKIMPAETGSYFCIKPILTAHQWRKVHYPQCPLLAESSQPKKATPQSGLTGLTSLY
jgi:hypothetical protein